jgi:pimeloyl-ACP methyl ester carboxylesterase
MAWRKRFSKSFMPEKWRKSSTSSTNIKRFNDMLFNIKEDKIKLSHGEVDYIAFGNGKRPLVMIQGLNTRGIKGAGLELAMMYRIFSKNFRVYLFDRRPHVTDKTTVREMAADVAEAIDFLGLKNACVLGVSQGGMIAEYLAIDRPDLVEKMALAMTISRNNETVISVIKKWIELTEKGDFKELVYDMAEKMYSENYMKKYRPVLPILTFLQKPKDTERFINLARACLTCDAYNELDKVRCKALVLGGEKDKIVGEVAAKEIADKLGCDLIVYKNLGHAAYEESPEFNIDVYNFFVS